MMLDNLDPDLRTSVIGFISGLLGVFFIFIKKIVGNLGDRLTTKRDAVVETLSVAKLIKDCLSNLLVDWDAGRACIVQFHNGGSFFTGGSMQKFSITHEEIAPGVNPMHKVLQNVIITNASWIGDVLDGTFVVPSVKKLRDVTTRTFFEEFGVESVIGIPLKKDNKVVGILMLQFILKHPRLDETCLSQLTEQCKNIPALLLHC
jgi:hypothetical protein